MGARREMIDLFGRCLALRLDPAELAALRARFMSSSGGASSPISPLRKGSCWRSSRACGPGGFCFRSCFRRIWGSSAPTAGCRPRPPGLPSVAAAGRALSRFSRAPQSRGIEPIVIKGAQSLLTGDPPWRYLRDFDLLIPDQADEAQAVLVAMGFSVPEQEAERRRRHHLPPLVRNDFPGLHRNPSASRQPICPQPAADPELAARSELRVQGKLRYRLLPQPLHVLYSLVHHHIGHAGDARGTISLKGLYEFAWEVERMTAAERQALQSRADLHPRLAVALDTWIAAAAALYRMPVEPPFAVHRDAAQCWQGTLERLDQPRPGRPGLPRRGPDGPVRAPRSRRTLRGFSSRPDLDAAQGHAIVPAAVHEVGARAACPRIAAAFVR